MRANVQWVVYDIEGKLVYKTSKSKSPYDKLWMIRSQIAEQRVGKHDVYWGCHACSLDKIHSGLCECSCGALPEPSSICWGEDFQGYTEVEMKRRTKLMSDNQCYVTDEVDYDLRETIANGKYDSSKKGRVKKIKARTRGRHAAKNKGSIDSN